MSIKMGAEWLCSHCAAVKPGEKVLVLCNEDTLEIATQVFFAVQNLGAESCLHMIPNIKIHGCEPPEATACLMANMDVIFCMTLSSLAHSKARLAATNNGARYLSLPDYSEQVMASSALHTDFAALAPKARLLTQLLDTGKSIQISSKKGTNLTLSIVDRKGNCAPGIVHEKGELGSPPDAEVNIAPIEISCEGDFIVDGSIPCAELGVLSSPLKLKFEKGRVTNVEGEDCSQVTTVNELFDAAGPNSRVLGEFGLGLNPNAHLCGVMLIDEGALGTIHLGIGSNITIGGNNDVSFHLDFVMKDATVSIDDTVVIQDGDLIFDL